MSAEYSYSDGDTILAVISQKYKATGLNPVYKTSSELLDEFSEMIYATPAILSDLLIDKLSLTNENGMVFWVLYEDE